MVKYIHEEFLQVLKEVNWMDKKTIDHAIQKARAISTHIGYPDEVLDPSKVGQLYENVTALTISLFILFICLLKFCLPKC